MTPTDKTGLDIEEHGTTLIVRINGGKHALLSPDIATQLGKLVDKADKDPNIHAVVFTGAHPDRFLSHADVAWLQEGGVGFPPINTRIAGIVSRIGTSCAYPRRRGLPTIDSLNWHPAIASRNSSKASRLRQQKPSR